MNFLKLKIFAGVVIICILWGSSWGAVRIGLENMPPILSLAIRLAVSCIILGMVLIIRREQIPRNRDFWRLAVILCLTSFSLPFVLIYHAQSRIGSGIASVLFATYPFWVAIISHFILTDEKISFVKVSGLTLGFMGTVFVLYNATMGQERVTFIGMAEIVAAAIAQAAGLVFLRKSSRNMNPVSLNFWPMVLSIIPLFAGSALTENYSAVQFDWKTVLSIVYLSVFCTAITFVIYFWLVKHIEAVVLSLSAFVTPVIAVIIGVLFLGELFSTNIYIGSSLVLAGVLIVTLGDRGIEYLRNLNAN